MIGLLKIVLLCLSGFYLFCSDSSNPSIPQSTGRFIYHQIYSEHVKDNYGIMIRLPIGYDEKLQHHYPVLFQLDANSQFDVTCGYVSEMESNGEIPQTIVAGIGYPYIAGISDPVGRNRDYTLPMEYPENAYGAAGGSEYFYKFICKELIPFIENKYSIAGPEGRAIIGHSYGGLFVMYSFCQYDSSSPCINGYLAASPSLWFDGGSFFKYLDSLKARQTNLPLILYMSVGDLEGLYMNVYYDECAARIQRSFTNLSFKKKKFSTDHLGNILPSYEDGIKYLYENGLREGQ